MSTTTNNITYTELVNATFRANNSADTNSAYNISADIVVTGTSVTSISNGQLTVKEGTGSGSFWADASNSHFDFYGMTTTTEQVEAVEAIRAFIDSAKNSAPANANPASL